LTAVDSRINKLTFSNNEALLRRAVLSLINVSTPKRSTSFIYRTLTFLNLFVGYLNLITKLYESMQIYGSTQRKYRMMLWPLNDCIVRVRFFDIEYNFYCPKGRDFNFVMNPYFHEYEVTTLTYFILRDGDNFIDIGAHGGLYTLFASRRVGNKGKVISMEPNPENLMFLRSNIELNRLKNVTVIPNAVGDVNRKITLFYSSSYTSLTSAFRKERKSFEADATTLDDIYLRYLEPDKVKLIKIDTEGYDLYALNGADYMLSKTYYVVVEQHSDDVKKFLTKKGFKVQQLRPSQCLFGTNLSLS